MISYKIKIVKLNYSPIALNIPLINSIILEKISFIISNILAMKPDEPPFNSSPICSAVVKPFI